MKTLATVFLTFGMALFAGAQGYVEAITSFSSPSTGENDGTIGYTFRANQALSVTDLGVFAYVVDKTSPMRVGLWDSAGNLLAEKLITTGSQLVGTSYYEALQSPVSLLGQQVYHIGAFYNTAPHSFSYNIVGGDFLGNVATSMGIELISYASNTNGFAFPTAVDGGQGLTAITANFRYPGVPEPAVASLALLAGFALLGARMRSSR